MVNFTSGDGESSYQFYYNSLVLLLSALLLATPGHHFLQDIFMNHIKKTFLYKNWNYINQ